MWFLIALLVVLWSVGVTTYGFGNYWIHGILGIAIAVYAWNRLATTKRND